jgi:hypothetical protein
MCATKCASRVAQPCEAVLALKDRDVDVVSG